MDMLRIWHCKRILPMCMLCFTDTLSNCSREANAQSTFISVCFCYGNSGFNQYDRGRFENGTGIQGWKGGRERCHFGATRSSSRYLRVVVLESVLKPISKSLGSKPTDLGGMQSASHTVNNPPQTGRWPQVVTGSITVTSQAVGSVAVMQCDVAMTTPLPMIYII